MFEQLRRAADAAQRILDFVRQIADQFAVGLLLLEQALFARRLQLLIDRPQLDQQTCASGVSIGLTVQFRCSTYAVAALEFDALAGIAPAVRQAHCRAPSCKRCGQSHDSCRSGRPASALLLIASRFSAAGFM